MNKKFFALLMAVVLVIGMLPGTVLADEHAHENIETVKAVDPTCTEDGNVEYVYCADCELYWINGELVEQKDTVVPALGHDYQIVETTATYCEAVCLRNCSKKTFTSSHTDDCYCELCDKVYHNVKHAEAVESTCTTMGNVEYWYCDNQNCCEYQPIWLDEACTQLTNRMSIKLSVSHNLLYVKGVDPTCTEEGRAEYWHCADCGLMWADDICFEQYANLEATVIPALKHDMTYVGTHSYCDQEGNKGHYSCGNCGKLYNDKEGKTEVTVEDITTEATGHKWVEYKAVDPTCTKEGNIAYKQCSKCGAAQTMDGVLLGKDRWVLAAKGHTLEKVEAKDATCTEDGVKAHYVCTTCKNHYKDEKAETKTYSSWYVIPALNHGNNQGADWIYHGYTDPTCYDNGHKGYFECPLCNASFATRGAEKPLTEEEFAEYILPCTGHTAEIKHKKAKAPTCKKNGNIEYWYCEDCGYAWLDEECKLNTNLKAVILPAAHQAEGYVNNGDHHIWYCTACNKTEKQAHDFSNGDCVCGATHEHAWVEYEAVEPTCTTEGNIAYMQCSLCGAAQTAGENPIPLSKFGWILSKDHTIVAVEAKDATCTENGNQAYWYCSECDIVFVDEALTQVSNRLNVVIPAGHKGTHYEAVAPTCGSQGNIEHWYCEACDTYWLDAECTLPTNNLAVILPASGEHKIEKVEGTAATCLDEGWKTYWHCTVCNEAWWDEDLTEKAGIAKLGFNWIAPLDHTIAHVAAKAPTADAEGNIEYWYCTVCGFAWADEELTKVTNLKSVILPKLEAPAASDPEASKPEASKPADTTKPSTPSEDEPSKTGDEVQIALMGTMMVLAVLAMAAVVLMKKSSFTGRFTK